MIKTTEKKIIDLMRIGGEAQFLVIHDDKKILDSFFISRAPVRAFEKMLIGKSPMFAVEAVMRICGICHAAHGINAVEAIEDALGIMPPPNGILLREIIGLINRIQSHILHFILIIPDLFRDTLKDELLMKSIKLLSTISDSLAKIGGAPTHPPNIIIGGIATMPKEKNLEATKTTLMTIMKEFQEVLHLMDDESKLSEKGAILNNTEFTPRLLASHLYYGDKTNIVLEKVKTLRVEEYRDVPDEAKNTTSLVAIYGDGPVEVGPRARLTLFWNFRDNTLLGLQKARIVEIILNAQRTINLINQIDPTEPTRTTTVIFRRGEGISVFEAPRGLLIHHVKLDDDGRISMFRIIVPTMFNIPIMEIASKGLPPEVGDVIPRLYDPCVPCTTHFIRVKK